MKKIFLIMLFLAIFGQITRATDNGPLKLIKTIGDDRENYTLFGFGDALLTPNKDIYILNTRGNFISIYDWKGNFKQFIGQKGQGPGDFYFPRSLAYYNNKIYIHDRGNSRIVELNLKNNKFSFYKQNSLNRLDHMKHVIQGDKFLGIFNNIDVERGRIGIIDKQFNILHSFFQQLPISYDLKGKSTALPQTMTPETAFRLTIINNSFEPVYAYQPKHPEILVSFMLPDNPVNFFVYNTSGKLLKTFSYKIEDEKYKFNDFFLTASMAKILNPKSYPARYEPYLRVFITENHYVGFLVLNDFPKGQKDVQTRHCYLLVFDRNGKLLKKFPLLDQTQLLRYNNGYFLGVFLEADIEKLYIYQLEMN